MPFTSEQQAVIEHPGGHALVSAVAGSGKTTTMVERIARLIEAGSDPRRIAVVMFNKDAQRQFEERLKRRLPKTSATLPAVRTFHAMAYGLLRKTFEPEKLMPAWAFEASDAAVTNLARDSIKSVVGGKTFIEQADLDEFLRYMDLCKASLDSPEKVFKAAKLQSSYQYFIAAFERFERQRENQRMRFFADLLRDPVRAMEREGRLAVRVANKIDHLIVDEYQDINAVQQALIKILAGERADVMVVGDPDQCIYEWRGARPGFIVRDFERDFPRVSRYALSRTWRYGHALSLAANHVITRNTERHDTLCVSGAGTPATVVEEVVSDAIAGRNHPIGEVLSAWQRSGRALQDSAILLRLWNQSVAIEISLLEAGIPYNIGDRESLFKMREIGALHCVVRLLAGDFMKLAEDVRRWMAACFLTTPGMGLSPAEAEAAGRRMAADPSGGEHAILGLITDQTRHLQRQRLITRGELWAAIAGGYWSGMTVDKALNLYTTKVDYLESLQRTAVTAESGRNRSLAAEAFLGWARSGSMTPAAFASRIDALIEAEKRLRVTDGGVQVTTVHRAKGLEWPLVVLPDLDEATFPATEAAGASAHDPAWVEGERRLFYVAATRAMERLVLVVPPDENLQAYRESGGREAPTKMIASRFVYEAQLPASVRLGKMLSAGRRPETTGDIAGRYLAEIDSESDRAAQSLPKAAGG